MTRPGPFVALALMAALSACAAGSGSPFAYATSDTCAGSTPYHGATGGLPVRCGPQGPAPSVNR